MRTYSIEVFIDDSAISDEVMELVEDELMLQTNRVRQAVGLQIGVGVVTANLRDVDNCMTLASHQTDSGLKAVTFFLVIAGAILAVPFLFIIGLAIYFVGSIFFGS